MKKRLLIIGCAVAVALATNGCKKDETTTPPVGGDTRIYMELVPNKQFTYNRTDLDTANQAVAGSTRQYVIDYKGSNNTIIGAYDDWIRRVGTDKSTLKQDTLFIRTQNGSNGTVSFTRNVMAYGFVNKIQQSLIAQVLTAFPAIAPPVVPGPQWDVIALFHDGDGAAFPAGKTWTLGDALGTTLSFNISGIPVSINVLTTGQLGPRAADATVGTTKVKTWESTVTATATVLTSSANVKIHMWFSDDPDGQIKLEQEGTVFVLPILNIPIPIPGERQELVSWK